MEGTLVVNEERQKINKFKKWYQEKIVDTNISKTVEKVVSFGTKFSSAAYKVIGDVAGAVCLVIPGAQVAAPICPVAGRLNSGIVSFVGNASIEGKRFVEAKIIGVDGSSKDVVIPKFSQEKVSNDLKGIVSNVGNVIDEVQKIEGAGKTL